MTVLGKKRKKKEKEITHCDADGLLFTRRVRRRSRDGQRPDRPRFPLQRSPLVVVDVVLVVVVDVVFLLVFIRPLLLSFLFPF